jgi:hypothetical protein
MILSISGYGYISHAGVEPCDHEWQMFSGFQKEVRFQGMALHGDKKDSDFLISDLGRGMPFST